MNIAYYVVYIIAHFCDFVKSFYAFACNFTDYLAYCVTFNRASHWGQCTVLNYAICWG